MSAQREQPFR